VTGTWQYVVADPATREAVIIDPVLDYNKDNGLISTQSADKLLQLIGKYDYKISRILETHAHADHLTASRYLQNVLAEGPSTGQRPQVCVGRLIQDVQGRMGKILNIPNRELDEAFDHTFDHDETFLIGGIEARVIHLPGHTPDHVGYIVGSNVFTGDSIFNLMLDPLDATFPAVLLRIYTTRWRNYCIFQPITNCTLATIIRQRPGRRR
jgi:glyoxylase-like metal-dependent hydrolase (beta-lactamase superfamily II)